MEPSEILPVKTFSSKKFEFDETHLQLIREYPHVLGHLVGKNKLTPLHSAWVKYMWDTNEDRSLQAHRGSFKTTSVLEVGALRWMLFHPNERIRILRKKFSDSAEIVSTIAEMLEMKEVQALFKFAHGEVPRFKIKRYGMITMNFKRSATPEGSLMASGLDTSLTGAHSDKFFCDDFVTLKDRISKAEREHTKEIIREIRTNIIDPGKPTSFLGTPWHKNDAWEVCPEPIIFNVADCGLLTPEEIEKKKKITTPSLYSINYELKHLAAENQLFANPVFDRWDYNVDGKVYGQLDAAFDGDHYNALTFMARRGDGTIQGVGFTYPGNVKDWYGEIKKLYSKYRCSLLFNETNPDKGYTASDLRKRGMNIREYAESQNKHIKISTELYGVWGDVVWSTDSDDEYMEQIEDYTEGQEPDDAPDSAASLIRAKFSIVKGDKSGLYRM